MRESVFIKQNISKWRDFEYTLSIGNQLSPTDKADMYIDLTSDLAFAQTHYPNAEITNYLNDLTLKLHNEIYKEKHENWRRIITFWTREVPEIIWKERRSLLISLIVFLVSIGIGAFSTAHDADFTRLIMGDDYVNMTLENIEKGKPMDVYGGDLETASFLSIMFNNVRVSFLAFTFGIFTSIAVGYFLFYNGVMVGAFLAFLFSHGVLGESWTAIMLHGTLELSAIVIAGGAGIAFGNGWLFPGSYSRMTALKLSAKRGLKIVLGTVPIFVVAAFIEGFFTRHVEWSLDLKLTIIGLSAAFVIFYYVIYPYFITHHGRD
ncbi:MAG: stage II sporulation protein M [Muribaculaceae bacterium]|nr:stage II sporulation protein M [Muribaculaceae bacterium]